MKITFEGSPEAGRLLGHLGDQGLFGKSKDEVAKEFVLAKLRETVENGWAGMIGYGDGQTLPIIQQPR